MAITLINTKYFFGNPYVNNINISKNKYIRAFPKSGCLIININIGEKSNIVFKNFPKFFESFFVRYKEKNKIKKGLNISENCILIPNNSIQRTAPLVSMPTINEMSNNITIKQ